MEPYALHQGRYHASLAAMGTYVATLFMLESQETLLKLRLNK